MDCTDLARNNAPDWHIPEELFRRAQAGDLQARNEIVLRNFPLLRMLVGECLRPRQADDLVQVAAVAAIVAVRSFRFDRDCQFSTYLARCVRNALRAYLRRDSTVVIPRVTRLTRQYRTEKVIAQRRARVCCDEDSLLEAEAALGRDPDPHPVYIAEIRTQRDALWSVVATELNEREQYVLHGLYRDGKSLLELAPGLPSIKGRPQRPACRQQMQQIADKAVAYLSWRLKQLGFVREDLTGSDLLEPRSTALLADRS